LGPSGRGLRENVENRKRRGFMNFTVQQIEFRCRLRVTCGRGEERRGEESGLVGKVRESVREN